jgi:hypothetical protein
LYGPWYTFKFLVVLEIRGQSSWKFPLYYTVLWGFPLFYPSLHTFWDFHFTARHYGILILPPAGRINVIYQRFDRGRKPNFRYLCDKNVIPRESCFNFDYRLPLCLLFRFLYCIVLTSVTRTLNGWWNYLLWWN